jgi:hypothetical protein
MELCPDKLGIGSESTRVPNESWQSDVRLQADSGNLSKPDERRKITRLSSPAGRDSVF